MAVEGPSSLRHRRGSRTTLISRDPAETLHRRRNRRATRIRDHTTCRHHLCRGCDRKVTRAETTPQRLCATGWSWRTSQSRDTPKSTLAWSTLTTRGGHHRSRKA
jgi:hypothetical protein